MEVDNKVVIIAVVLVGIVLLGNSRFTGGAAARCTDDTDGNNPSIKGAVNYFGKLLNEICFDKNYVLEYYCENGGLKYKRYPCENGCSDGVCKPSDQKRELGSLCTTNSECKTNYCAFNSQLNKNTCQLKSHGRECNPNNEVNECYGKCLTVKGNVIGEGKSFCCPSDRSCVDDSGDCRFEGMNSKTIPNMICKNGIWVGNS